MRTTASNMNFTNSHIISKLNICHSSNADVYEHEVRIQEFKFALRNVGVQAEKKYLNKLTVKSFSYNYFYESLFL